MRGNRSKFGWGRAWLISLAAIGMWGCERAPTLDDSYGRLRGTDGGGSVNGTGVLARMFAEAGHQVFRVRRLSPRLDQVDVVVWVPDDFRPPTSEQYEFFEAWLGEGSNRTLVFVGRDFDAMPIYWEKVLSDAPPDQAWEIKRRLAQAHARMDSARIEAPADYQGRWFRARRDVPRRRVQTLEGPWSEGLDASNSEIYLHGRFDTPASASESGDADFTDTIRTETLLASEGDVLAARVERRHWDGSKIIVVTNGSFLLNLPLVNHEHCKLAGRLIETCGAPGKSVAFLESGPGGPVISGHETQVHYLLQAFTVWPTSCILLHVTVLGVVFCFSAFPIFGRPRGLPLDSRSDFGKHVDALGRLLERTADREYAKSRIALYQQTVKGDAP